MALKYPALWSLWSDDPEDASAMPQGLWTLDAHHGQANGLLAGDEHLNGRSPTRGSELCSVVEMMFSLEQLLLITGQGFYADRLELVAYNALPATFDGRMRVHQYLQQVNQVLCNEAPRPWINNGPRANLFGLEPEFGCCTANFHQAWPRFAGSLWMRTRDGGLACGAIAPSEVTATVAGGHRVAVHEQTLYPFGDEVTFTMTEGEDVRFPLDLRIPGWCRAATVDGRPAAAGSRVRIERSWSVGDRVVLKLPRRLRGERRHRGALSLYAGPLLMALPIPDRWELLPGESEPFGDRAVHPRGPWSYALELSDGDLESIEIPAAEVDEVPFDEELPPLRLPLRGRRVADWELVNHEAGPTPMSPLRTEGPSVELNLVPFGATILRIAEFPTVGPGEAR